jgi:hypothetical protein
MKNYVNDWTIDELGRSMAFSTTALNTLYDEQQGKRHKLGLSKRKTRAMMRQKTTREELKQ